MQERKYIQRLDLQVPLLLTTMVTQTSATVTQTSTMASRLSYNAQTRLPSAIRSLYPAEKLPGMISLLSGKPNGQTFPIRRISMDVDVQGSSSVTLNIEGQDLEDALQYSPTAGLPRLVDWVEALQARVHRLSRPSPHWRCSIGAGSQDLLTKVGPSFKAKRLRI